MGFLREAHQKPPLSLVVAIEIIICISHLNVSSGPYHEPVKLSHRLQIAVILIGRDFLTELKGERLTD